MSTYAIYFANGENWYLHSWGHTRENVPDLVREVWEHDNPSGIRVVPTPEHLATIPA